MNNRSVVVATRNDKKLIEQNSNIDSFVDRRTNRQGATAMGKGVVLCLSSFVPATTTLVILLLTSGTALLSLQQQAYADTAVIKTNLLDRFNRSAYAGAGLGLSRLNPDTSRADGWDPNDRVNKGGQVNIGVDVSKLLSLELHSADLGSAGLSPAGRINYHVNGASALLYAGENRHRYLRRGLSAFGRLGLGSLNNSPVGAVPFQKINAHHFLLGAGVEYMTRSGFGARAEFISFDQDVKYGQLGLIYRLGRRAQTLQTATLAQTQPKLAAAHAAQLPAPQVISATPSPCLKLDGVLTGVNFLTDSAVLTNDATVVLDQVADVLSRCLSVPIEVAAHTDSIGDVTYNMNLSERRAASVVSYLRDRGIDVDRLRPLAFGESSPIDSNDTPDGRRVNRRVELIAREIER